MPRKVQDWSLLVTFAIGLFCAGPIGIVAQTSTAVCLDPYSWMDNSKGQNPCTVAAYLQGACNGGQFTIDPLPANTHYIGPYANQADECQCSSVTYSAISACGACQNRTIISWSVWDFNCTVVYAGVFPAGIPDGTAVPAWAFQDVTASNLFNVTLAELVGDSPEDTPSSRTAASNAQSTVFSIQSTTTSSDQSTIFSDQSTSSVGTGSTPSVLPSPSLTSLPSTSSVSSSSSNTGAIAGGVVGSVIGVALIAGAITLFVMKKRSQALLSAQPTDSGHTDLTHIGPQMVAQSKFYDPSNPVSPPSTTIMNVSLGDAQSPTYVSPVVHPGYYSGAPEI